MGIKEIIIEYGCNTEGFNINAVVEDVREAEREDALQSIAQSLKLIHEDLYHISTGGGEK